MCCRNERGDKFKPKSSFNNLSFLTFCNAQISKFGLVGLSIGRTLSTHSELNELKSSCLRRQKMFKLSLILVIVILAIPGVSLAGPEAPDCNIVPELVCVKSLGDGDYEARWGYNSSHSGDVTIPIGPNNLFAPTPIDRGQVTVFQPGEHGQENEQGVFTVLFRWNEVLVWSLDGGGSATATKFSKECGCPNAVTISSFEATSGGVWQRLAAFWRGLWS